MNIKKPGKLVYNGNQVYHTIENREDTSFKVAGCWAHARRPFAQIYKSLSGEKALRTVAAEALVQIQSIYRTDNQQAEANSASIRKNI